MSLTNLCSGVLIKDIKMRQIINNLFALRIWYCTSSTIFPLGCSCYTFICRRTLSCCYICMWTIRDCYVCMWKLSIVFGGVEPRDMFSESQRRSYAWIAIQPCVPTWRIISPKLGCIDWLYRLAYHITKTGLYRLALCITPSLWAKL